MRALSASAVGPAALPCRARQARAGSTSFSRHHAVRVVPFIMKAPRTACKTLACAGVVAAMETPSESSRPTNVDNANDLSNSFAFIVPSGGPELGDFISLAAFALGGREADLARELGVSRATLSSWKARGALPPKYRKWFEEEFPVRVLSSRGSMAGDDFRHAGIDATLCLLHLTDFNPFCLSGLNNQERYALCSNYFGGLVRLSHFVQLALPAAIEQMGRGNLYESVAEVVGEAARRSSAHLFPGARVSQ